MYAGVIHTVKNPRVRAGAMRSLDPTRFPAGHELLPTGTSPAVGRAVCLRRAPNVAELQASLDQLMGGAAVDDCFVVPDEFAYAVSGTAGSAGV
ncbi:MAG TPA: hypothetical protein VGO74_13865 [Modestobacter sp.]|jgi:hypothetical protein|nr:hypothetical protein [Modestobacter sp.]